MQQNIYRTASKKLLLRFVLDSIEFRKRSAYLQDIISLSKIDDVWRQALLSFFNIPLQTIPLKAFSLN
jgi:hypothetical protein